MKKIFMYAMLFAAASATVLGFNSCSSDDPDHVQTLTEEEGYLQKVLGSYVDNTINPTYASMAKNAETFYEQMKTLRDAVEKGTATQAMVDKACESWKATRANYEMSEAFLLGAASDYNIDPHIDTWPLDLTALHNLLSSPNLLKNITTTDDEANIEYAHNNLNQNLLGFHAVEFVIFRNGAPRKVSSFTSGNDNFNDGVDFRDINALDELKYSVAVAGDLKYSVFELEVCWAGGTEAHKKALEAQERKTSMPSSTITYGENMKKAGQVGSLYTSIKSAVSAILSGDHGCVGIVDEVGQTKMGKPYGLGTNDENKESDPNYIESPFSHNSLTDFWDNIQSVNNVWNGGFDANKRSSMSFASYFKKYNPELGTKVQNAINNAEAKLKACPAPFVANYKNPQVLAAINACDELTKALGAADEYIQQKKK